MYTLIKTMMAIKEAQVATTWENVFVDLIEAMPAEMITSDVIKFCVTKGNLAETERNRLLCCRLVAAMAKKMNPIVIEQELSQRIVSLCQDTAFVVRQHMAQSMGGIMVALG